MPETERIRRPRMSPAREHELLTAALDLLREVGYEALTMDTLATQAHCSKATLYRMWPTKPELVAAAIRVTGPTDAKDIDTGSLRGDLVAMASRFTPRAAQDTALIAALDHAALTNPDLAATLRSVLLEPDTAVLTHFLDRAVERGELPEQHPTADLLSHLFFAVFVTRPLFDGSFADTDYMTRFIDELILPALHTPLHA
ncbi:TetR/AcrR family transcriptional regulator [Nocardia concava]|uniref:TetR/AcrR family transcriptional regulator n=1 Tax=Nocardia concava TaxID=257281 RepID=UPI0002E6A8D0|nr:TetR/AcrR family transcriptional regulator [Nocardia concava]